jgi:hypothetical protein
MSSTDGWTWDKTKIVFEILALIGAAVFAVFTWGVDSWRLSSPNWAVSFGKVDEYTAVVDNNRVRICKKASCKNASACIVQSKVITKNQANTPLNVENTNIRFYSYDKKLASGFANQSSYNAYKSLCKSNSSDKNCPRLIGELDIGPIDPQPLYPGHESWRPFTIEIVPDMFTTSSDLTNFAISNGVLIVAKQEVKPKGIWSEGEMTTSTASLSLYNLCNKSSFGDEDIKVKGTGE